MSKIKLSVLAVSVFISLVMFACKGKTGPAGAGSTQTVYTGTLTTTLTSGRVVDEISAPAMTINSDVQVRYSSDTITWWDYGFNSINLTSKKIQIDFGPSVAGWNYNATIRD